MRVNNFIKNLSVYSDENVFNPYSDICDIYDRHDGNKIRLSNLNSVLSAFSDKNIESIWIGRDLGHRGGRRTGLALTDEANLKFASGIWKVKLKQATNGDIFVERTAATIWNHLKLIDKNIFMWNVFPFHPHEPGKPLSNRAHTSRERDIGLDTLVELISILRPKNLVAIGNDAFRCSAAMFHKERVFKIRHPSYGGEKIFSKQISQLYGLRN